MQYIVQIHADHEEQYVSRRITAEGEMEAIQVAVRRKFGPRASAHTGHPRYWSIYLSANKRDRDRFGPFESLVRDYVDIDVHQV